MKLDDQQTKQVVRWIEEGAKLSEIQNRIAVEFERSLTYMEVRLLVDDLRLIPKDQTPKVEPQPAQMGTKTPNPTIGEQTETAAPSVRVSVSVDQITRPGAIVSGKVVFTDGQSAEWSLDQMGRLGFAPNQKGYKPSNSDIQEFQTALQAELAKLGF